MVEAELQQKVKDKLERKYGVGTVVWEKSGTVEHGVDLIYMLGPVGDTGSGTEFGETIYIGIQFKLVKSMGAGDAQKAIGQAAVAFGHEFTTSDDQKIHLHLVYVMNYGGYTANAEEYLSDARNTLKGLKWFDKVKLEPYLVDTGDITSMIQGDDDA